MARAGVPRPRALSVVFGAYFLLAVLFSFYLSPSVSVYVDPGATAWLCAAYVLLGAIALTGICAGALGPARRLDARLDDLEAVRQDRRIPSPTRSARRSVPPARVAAPIDSGSPDYEVAVLLDGLEEMSSVASTGASGDSDVGAGLVTEPITMEDFPRVDARELKRLRTARDAIVITLLGPALAAIAVVGVFAPLVPASDGMLLANLPFVAFVELAGLACLAGVLGYSAAAFRQIRRRAR